MSGLVIFDKQVHTYRTDFQRFEESFCTLSEVS